MARPLRLEFPNALYHVTSRGDRQEAIYWDDVDRLIWLDTLALTCERHNFVVHSFCQMTNHYHILIETIEGNLSQGMRQLNGLYTQHFNRRHGQVGHLFQGRYKAILVQKESHLLELARYIVLNPLRAGVVASLDDWRWSSYPYFLGKMQSPRWLAKEWLLSQFGASTGDAMPAYCDFVAGGLGCASPLSNTRHQLLLGDKEFVARHKQQQPQALPEISKSQRRALALPLHEYRDRYPNRHEAMARAYLSTAFSMSQIAAHFKVSPQTVSRAVRKLKV